MNIISSMESQSSYVSKTSYKSTIRTEYAESVNSMSEDEKLEAFKKEVWKELDSLPWNSSVDVSIQITDSAFKRMMNDDDFKNRMMSKIHEDASVCRSPIVSCLLVIDENGYRGVSYNDYNMSNVAFKAHSKHKDSFYVKKAKTKEVNEAWEKAKQRKERQREILQEEYWKKYFANKAFVHQEQVANMYYNNVPVADTQVLSYADELDPATSIL